MGIFTTELLALERWKSHIWHCSGHSVFIFIRSLCNFQVTKTGIKTWKPGAVVRSDACPATFFRGDWSWNNFSAILFLLLIQEGQLLAKKYAPSTGKLPRRLVQNSVDRLTGWEMTWRVLKGCKTPIQQQQHKTWTAQIWYCRGSPFSFSQIFISSPVRSTRRAIAVTPVVRVCIRGRVPVTLRQSFISKFSKSSYLNSHSSESIYIWTIGTLESRLSLHDSWPQGWCPGVGLEVKI